MASKHRRGALVALLIALCSVVVLVPSATAVHDLGLFELDRNATDGAAAGDDWSPAPAGATSFTGILADDAAGGDQFHGGGSKDDLDVSQWRWKPGDPLDKDNITNGYAASYVSTMDTGDTDIGDIILYFGLDRFANNGSAQVGIWFFQNDIAKTNIASGGGFTFSGVHANNDILVQSNFSQGGVISRVSVFKWLNGALVPVIEAADCLNDAGDPNPGDDGACATVNRGDTPAPWPYTPKFGTPGIFPQGSFYEGGLNVTRLVPDAQCFTDVMVETRSSTPFDSRLFDFTLGEFQACEPSIVTTPVDANGDEDHEITLGESIQDQAVVEGTGAFAPDPQGIVTFSVCKVDEPTLCELGDPTLEVVSVESLLGNTENPVTVTSDPFTPDEIGRYCFRAAWTDDPNYDDASDNSANECFTVVQIPTTLTTKQSWIPNDTAKIVFASGSISGNVAFSLFDNATCAGTAVYSETVAVSGTSPASASTTNTTVSVSSSGTYSWLVVFTPDASDPGHSGSESACNAENTVLTMNGNDPTIP
jgi:hypothetical protein